MAIPYRGEMFMGDVTTTIPTTVYMQFYRGVTELPYVSGTAIIFTGNLDIDDNFVPDGQCWPAEESVPGSGLVSNGVLALAGATHARIYARVSCKDWVAE